MSTDNLDSTTDAELSTIFALECADAKEGEGVPTWTDGSGIFRESNWPSFATCANEVLAFLESEDEFPEITRPCVSEDYNAARVWQVQLDDGFATAPTFERAVCIALIRSKRSTK